MEKKKRELPRNLHFSPYFLSTAEFVSFSIHAFTPEGVKQDNKAVEGRTEGLVSAWRERDVVGQLRGCLFDGKLL